MTHSVKHCVKGLAERCICQWNFKAYLDFGFYHLWKEILNSFVDWSSQLVMRLVESVAPNQLALWVLDSISILIVPPVVSHIRMWHSSEINLDWDNFCQISKTRSSHFFTCYAVQTPMMALKLTFDNAGQTVKESFNTHIIHIYGGRLIMDQAAMDVFEIYLGHTIQKLYQYLNIWVILPRVYPEIWIFGPDGWFEIYHTQLWVCVCAACVLSNPVSAV